MALVQVFRENRKKQKNVEIQNFILKYLIKGNIQFQKYGDFRNPRSISDRTVTSEIKVDLF